MLVHALFGLANQVGKSLNTIITLLKLPTS